MTRSRRTSPPSPEVNLRAISLVTLTPDKSTLKRCQLQSVFAVAKVRDHDVAAVQTPNEAFGVKVRPGVGDWFRLRLCFVQFDDLFISKFDIFGHVIGGNTGVRHGTNLREASGRLALATSCSMPQPKQPRHLSLSGRSIR